MSNLLVRVPVALAFSLLLTGQLVAQSTPNPFDRIIATRNNINTISFQMEYEKSGNGKSTACRYQVWISKDKIRYDKINLTKPADGEFFEREFVCVNCEGHFMFTGQVGDGVAGKKSTPVLFFDKGDRHADALYLNWRYIGIYPSDLSGLAGSPDLRAAMNYRAFVDNPKGHKIAIHDEGNARKRLEIKYNTNTASTLNVYFDDAKARTVKMTQVAKGYEESVDHFYEDATQDVIPSRITSRITVGESKRTEEMRISNVEINKPIDPKVFTLAGCDLPDYTIIKYNNISDHRQYPVWRDGKVDTSYTLGKMADESVQKMRESGAAVPVPDSAPPSGVRDWPYLVGGALLAVVGFLLLRKTRKR